MMHSFSLIYGFSFIAGVCLFLLHRFLDYRYGKKNAHSSVGSFKFVGIIHMRISSLIVSLVFALPAAFLPGGALAHVVTDAVLQSSDPGVLSVVTNGDGTFTVRPISVGTAHLTLVVGGVVASQPVFEFEVFDGSESANELTFNVHELVNSASASAATSTVDTSTNEGSDAQIENENAADNDSAAGAAIS